MREITSSNIEKETAAESASAVTTSAELLTEAETTVTSVPETVTEEYTETTYTEGVEEYEQTGVSEYTSWEASYSGQTAETSAAESSEVAEEAESADEGVSEAGIETESGSTLDSLLDTESEEISETVSDIEQPVIAFNMQQAQAFSLIAAAFGVLVAAAVMVAKARKRKKQKDDLSALTAKERDEIRLQEKKKKKPKETGRKKKHPAPKTVQQTMPYRKVCDDSIILVDEGRYSKTYQFEDINYSIAKQDEQESIFLGYCSVLNSFDTSADIQITVHNNRVNKSDFECAVLLKHTGDGFDKYRDEYNDMLVEKMEQGQNGIIRNKYMTVTVQASDLESAKAKFSTIDLDLTNAFKKIGSNLKPLSSNERIRLLKDIFRGVDEEIPELDHKQFRRGADKGYCCPDYMEFKKHYFMWGDKYARTMFIKDMPASLKDNMLTDIANTNLDVMVTVNISPVDPYKALKIVNHQLTSMRANKLQAEKKAIQSGYTSDVISEDLKHSLAEAEELLDDLRSKNQKMFLDNIIIMVTAKDKDELEANTEAIEAVVRKHICSLSILKYQQEKGLQSVLPLGNCTLKIRRTLTTESTAVVGLVIERFLSALDKPYTYLEKRYEFEVEGEIFKLTTKLPIELGWRAYNNCKDVGAMISYDRGQTVLINCAEVRDCETKPPAHFTEASLLAVMENIDRRIDDKELKSYVKEHGLGTPATRAQIIEGLISAKYIERRKKLLFITDFGKKFISALPENIKSAELTAHWEQMLSDIEQGKCGEGDFMNEIIKNVNDVIANDEVAIEPAEQPAEIGKCPWCGSPIKEGPKAFYCSNGEDCDFFIYKQDKRIGRSYTADEISELLANGRVTLRGCTSSKGNKYAAVFKLDDSGEYVNLKFVEFVKKKKEKKGE